MWRPSIDYLRPTSLTQTVDALRQGGERARVFSGGTDLLVQIREGRRAVDLLIDLKLLPEANELRIDAQGLTLGAAVSCARLYRHPEIALRFPGLVDSASLIGGTQIQSRASLGGNLCNASPAADSIPTLIALRANCRLAGPDGERTVLAEALCTGPGQNALRPGEFLVSFTIPATEPRSGAAFLRFIPRNEMDIAVVNAAAAITLDSSGKTVAGARLAIGAVAPTPLLIEGVDEALAGQPADSPDWRSAAELARAAARPITDMRGSAGQRRHLAAVLAQRSLDLALARAKEAL